MAFQATTISNTTPTTIITPIANYSNDLLWLIATNTSATGTRVDLTTSGGATCSIFLPPTSTLPLIFPGPIPAGIGAAWTATLGTAVTDVRLFASYYSHQ